MPARPARTALLALTALLLVLPTAARADDGKDRDHDHDHDRGRHRDTVSTYVLDPVGPAADDIFPEGIAVRGTTFYVGSTTDGTVYRGTLHRRVATPFLLPDNPEGRTVAVGMTVDGRTLFVAGGPTGQLFAYDLRTRDLVGRWSVADPTDPDRPTFLNDVVVSREGDVYVTDSLRPVLYRIDADDRRTDGVEPLPTFVDFTGTALTYAPGFNVNGVVVSRDDRYLVVAQSNTASLFRVGLRDRSVVRIDLDGAAVAGDGLVLDRRTLYAVERQGDTGYVVEIDLDRRLTSGEVERRTSDPTFDDPTTAALVGRSLLVVNSQFGERAAGEAPDPFTVSRVPVR